MTGPERIPGETATSFRPSTMSALTARASLASENPAQEIEKLLSSAEHRSAWAHLRIGGILAQMGTTHQREARKHLLDALEECEWRLEHYYDPGLRDTGICAWNEVGDLQRACGTISEMLGTMALQSGRAHEAIRHFERGVHYYHSESSLFLALLEKERGRLDRAQYLLTSVLTDPASDATYLLGDLFTTRGNPGLADAFFRQAASAGHNRAISRMSPDKPSTTTSGPMLRESVHYGHGWKAEIDHLHGGIALYWRGEDVDDLAIPTFVGGVDSEPSDTTPDIYYELTIHQAVTSDHRVRTFAVGNSTKSALIRNNSDHHYADTVVDVCIADQSTGEIIIDSFDTVREALENLRLVASLHPDESF